MPQKKTPTPISGPIPKTPKVRRSRAQMIAEDLQKVHRTIKKVWLDTEDPAELGAVGKLITQTQMLDISMRAFFSKQGGSEIEKVEEAK